MINFSSVSTEHPDIIFPVVIAGGRNTGANKVDNVEVIDSNTNCKVDRIPMQLSGAAGINGMICGGIDYDRDNILSGCWHLNPSGEWTAGEDMLEKRMDFTITKVGDEVIVIGGETTSQHSLKGLEK